jgi:hypothetical protein
MSWGRKTDGLVVMRPIDELMSRVDDLVEGAIRNGTIGPHSPYAGWTLAQFQAQRPVHATNKKALVGRRD